VTEFTFKTTCYTANPDKPNNPEILLYTTLVTVTHVSEARRQGVAACADPEAEHRFPLLVACLLNMVVTYHQRQLHIKIQGGILTAEPYQPATHGDLLRQQQLEFLRLNPAKSWENALLNILPRLGDMVISLFSQRVYLK
jgi:hypothetical protein